MYFVTDCRTFDTAQQTVQIWGEEDDKYHCQGTVMDCYDW